MKLNYRDKILLLVVFVILLLVLGVMIFIKPAISTLSDTNQKLTNAKNDLTKLQQQIEQDKNLTSEIQKLFTETTKVAANFYDYQTTYNATATVLKSLENDNISNKGMAISGYSSTQILPFTYTNNEMKTNYDTKVNDYNSGIATTSKAAAATTTTTDDVAAGTDYAVGNYQITFAFTSTLDDFKKYCDNLTTNNQKSLIITNCSITDINKSTISGTLTMNMMVMRKLSDPLKTK